MEALSIDLREGLGISHRVDGYLGSRCRLVMTFIKQDSRVQNLGDESLFADEVIKSLKGQLRCSKSYCK